VRWKADRQRKKKARDKKKAREAGSARKGTRSR
jgi:hypothetical protein